MTRSRATGFVMVGVIVLIGLMGMALLVLTIATNNITFESKRMYLDAGARNLSASGLAWAKQNAPKVVSDGPAKVGKLDIEALGIADGELNVTADRAEDGHVTVRVAAMCRSGRHTVRRHLDHVLSKSP